MTAHTGTEISSLRIGTVTAVRGRQIDVTVDVDKNDSSLIFQGEIISNVSIDSFLVVRRGYSHLVVQVEEEELIENKAWENGGYQRDVDRNTRILKTVLLGEFKTDTSASPFHKHFISGSQTTPLIGNIAYLASAEQASKIYVSESAPGTQITIGHLANNITIPFSIDISSFFSTHIGIFGNTGSGKSHTLSQIYTQLFERTYQSRTNEHTLNSSQFILFDLNGEYRHLSHSNISGTPILGHIYGLPKSNSDTIEQQTNLIPLPVTTIQDIEFWISILEASEHKERDLIRRTLETKMSPNSTRSLTHYFLDTFFTWRTQSTLTPTMMFLILRRIHTIADPNHETFSHEIHEFEKSIKRDFRNQTYYIDQPSDPLYTSSPFFTNHLDSFFDRAFSETFTKELTALDKFEVAFYFTYIAATISGNRDEAQINTLLTRVIERTNILRKWFIFTPSDSSSYPALQIVNLEQATQSERYLIPLITIRARYTEQRKRSILSNNPTYLNFIIEEAHTLLSHGKHIEDNYHQNALLDSLEQIIIEGRHLGIFLTLSSQRPSEISTRITSQLHHYLIHRLVNPTDLACIQSAISFLDSKSFESIPSLPCGTCIISGTSIQIPAVVKIDELPEGRRPDNETINLVKLWGLDSGPAVEDDSDSSVSTSTRAKSAADADSTRASDT